MATKSSTSGKPSNRIVIGSLPDSITPFKLKDLLATIGPIEVRDVNVSLGKSVDKCCKNNVLFEFICDLDTNIPFCNS